MGEMAYVGTPSRGSSNFPYNRSAIMEDITSNAHFSNLRGGIEEDLALIRQGERAQQPLSDEGMYIKFRFPICLAVYILFIIQILKMPVKQISRRKKTNTMKSENSKLLTIIYLSMNN